MRAQWRGIADAWGGRGRMILSSRRAFIQRLVAPSVVLLAAACSQAAPAPAPTTAPAAPTTPPAAAPKPTAAPAAQPTSAAAATAAQPTSAAAATTAPAAAPTRP